MLINQETNGHLSAEKLMVMRLSLKTADFADGCVSDCEFLGFGAANKIFNSWCF